MVNLFQVSKTPGKGLHDNRTFVMFVLSSDQQQHMNLPMNRHLQKLLKSTSSASSMCRSHLCRHSDINEEKWTPTNSSLRSVPSPRNTVEVLRAERIRPVLNEQTSKQI